jgi:transketolase N-terminal domain/subunit
LASPREENAMAITSSKSGKVLQQFNIDLARLCAAGSGHVGSTLSIMDITAALYLRGLL